MRPIQDNMNRLWNFFTSIKLSVILLLVLAATSVIGTVIPQNETPEKYIQAFGEILYKIFDIFNFFDMYHSWWFQLLILMLTANIVACSIHRLSTVWKIVFVTIPPFNISRFRKISHKEEFTDNRSPEELIKIYERFVSKRFGYSRVEETDKGLCVFAEKWRWTRLGVYAVHLSVLLMLLGGLIGSIFGFKGYINIPEGETINSIKLRNIGKVKDLGFEVRCEDFSVSFYDSGSPKEFRSSLTIIEAGQPVLQKDIVVNDPLRYKGINIFQSSYGMLPPRELTLSFVNSETGKSYKKDVTLGQQIDIPADMGKLIIKGFRNSADFRGHNIGETFFGTLAPKNGNPIFLLLPLRYPNFDMMRKGKVIVSVAGYKQNYYTGLQVTGDSGVLVVYTGFIVMIIGIYITFFVSHQRLCIELRKSGKTSSVMVTGSANKNKLGMQNKITKIAQKLAELKQSA
jgi:cytochrome c biogenesis protein